MKLKVKTQQKISIFLVDFIINDKIIFEVFGN
jgi:very-short-patch-repair endonuclease